MPFFCCTFLSYYVRTFISVQLGMFRRGNTQYNIYCAPICDVHPVEVLFLPVWVDNDQTSRDIHTWRNGEHSDGLCQQHPGQPLSLSLSLKQKLTNNTHSPFPQNSRVRRTDGWTEGRRDYVATRSNASLSLVGV